EGGAAGGVGGAGLGGGLLAGDDGRGGDGGQGEVVEVDDAAFDVEEDGNDFEADGPGRHGEFQVFLGPALGGFFEVGGGRAGDGLPGGVLEVDDDAAVVPLLFANLDVGVAGAEAEGERLVGGIEVDGARGAEEVAG